MILLNLDRASKTPLHQQVTAQIRGLIERGALPVGSALPPTRTLAKRLGVNRTTVYRAYQELWALGLVEGRPGSYSRVRACPRLSPRAGTARPAPPDWEGLVSEASRQVYSRYLRFKPEPWQKPSGRAVNFSALDMDPALIPAEAFRRCLNAAFRREGAGLLGYSQHAGYPPLRRIIARRLQVHGIEATEEEVLITNGSQHGLDLALRLFAAPGRAVAVEAPTYAQMLPLLRLHRAEISGVRMMEGGMDLDALEATLAGKRPSLVYTMPNFQNPTGVSTTQAHREKLLGLCDRHGVPLLEDGFEEEMKYFGRVALPIKSMDKSQRVVYLGTFSKVLMPGVRVGWVVAHRECIERLTAIRRFADLSAGGLLQAGLEEFCSQGLYDLHLRRLHRVYRKRMQVMLSALKEHLPEERVSWTEPSGGYLIWVEVEDRRRSCAEVCEHLGKRGVIVSPGHFYFDAPPPRPCFRLSIATTDEAQIVEGARRMGSALAELK